MLKPFKYIVQAVVIECDDEDKIVREIPAEAITLYSKEAVVEALESFEKNLTEADTP